MEGRSNLICCCCACHPALRQFYFMFYWNTCSTRGIGRKPRFASLTQVVLVVANCISKIYIGVSWGVSGFLAESGPSSVSMQWWRVLPLFCDAANTEVAAPVPRRGTLSAHRALDKFESYLPVSSSLPYFCLRGTFTFSCFLPQRSGAT